MKYINTRFLLQAASFIMGASTMLLTLAKTYIGLVAYAITFSSADGVMLLPSSSNASKPWTKEEKLPSLEYK